MKIDPAEARVTTTRLIADLIGQAPERRAEAPVAGAVDAVALAARLKAYDFTRPVPLAEAAADLLDLLETYAVRSDHPRYFGLFNPPALEAAVIGDLIASVINPQLAVWSHAPAAVEIEAKLVRFFCDLVWPGGEGGGSFTGGGSEANHTALLVALARRYPDWPRLGLPREGRRPTVYASAECHLAWIKLARAAGLGDEAVRLVPAPDGLALTRQAVERTIASDVDRDPFMIVATAGTTAHGAIDDLAGLTALGAQLDVHVHIDAAWAGAALIEPSLARLLDGIAAADSVTIDPHKQLCVPMGAGLILVRKPKALATVFAVHTSFMPEQTGRAGDPYLGSLQWSRRFIGAKLFLALSVLGLDGYRALLTRQQGLGQKLRDGLSASGWVIENRTELPLVCFSSPVGQAAGIREIEAAVMASGEVWLSSVLLRGAPVLRACITSFETTDGDVDALIARLNRALAGDTSPDLRV